MDLSIIIVNWNSTAYLQKCIASLFAQTRGLTFEIVVIDSASFDGCGEMLREHFPQVRFVQSSVNLGFAKANNRAFELTSGNTLLFLNPDTEAVGAAIDTMHARLNSLDKAGVVGSKLLNADRTIQSSCVQAIPTIVNQVLDAEILRRRWPTLKMWGMAPLYANDTTPQEVEVISGACLMMKRGVFEQVGRFSEEYFMYAEDLDLAEKVREAGYRNYFLPDATVIHYGGSSSDQVSSTFSAVMMPEAISRFLRKTRGRMYSRCYRCALGFAAAARLAVLGVARMISGPNASVDGAVRKWGAVLRWSVKKDGVVERYYTESTALLRSSSEVQGS